MKENEDFIGNMCDLFQSALPNLSPPGDAFQQVPKKKSTPNPSEKPDFIKTT